MKSLICAALVLALLCGAGLSETGGAAVPGNRLGLETLRLMADGGQNQFVSPVSLAYALSLAATGAGGETREVLLAALDAASPGDMAALNDALAAAGLKWANAAFAREELPINPDYIEALTSDYAAECFPLDAAERVNAWVCEKTDGLIERLLDGEIDPEVRLMLVNAIAMDANWQTPFDAENTMRDVFHAPDGDVEADFMGQTLDARYAEIDGAQVIRLDYYDSGLYMLVALPPEGGVPALLDALAADGLAAIDPGDEWREVALRLPKMDIGVTNGLTDVLAALGLVLPFSDAADFYAISAEGLKISEVLQKVRVQVDELGTRAAAVTELMLKDNGISPLLERPVVMKVDRPFVVVIADEATGAVCFAGVVADPTA